MQVIYPSNRPSPLEGLSEGMGTLADAIIKSREKQAFQEDTTLVGQALAKMQGGGNDPMAWQKDPGAEVPFGDVPEQPGQGAGARPGRAQVIETLQGLLPNLKTEKMQTQVGQVLTKMVMEENPRLVDLYTAEGKPTGQQVDKDAHFLKAKEDTGTSVYNPKTGEWTRVPGKFAQMKPEQETQILDAEGQVVGSTTGKVFQIKNPKKEWKPELFENEAGDRKFIVPGEEVPEGYSMAGKASRSDPTGFTREGVSWMKMVGLDPRNKASWDEFNGFRRLAKDKDVGMWALDKATTALSKNFSFNKEKDPFKRARMAVDQARELMKGRDVLAGEAAGQPAVGKAGKPPSYPQQVQGPGGVYTKTGQFDPTSGKPLYQSPDGRLMLPK